LPSYARAVQCQRGDPGGSGSIATAVRYANPLCQPSRLVGSGNGPNAFSLLCAAGRDRHRPGSHQDTRPGVRLSAHAEDRDLAAVAEIVAGEKVKPLPRQSSAAGPLLAPATAEAVLEARQPFRVDLSGLVRPFPVEQEAQ
jgi:hypothetical protein